MRFLVIDTYYTAFLNSFYARQPELTCRTYTEQWQMLMNQCFGTADFYSKNLKRLDQEATEVIANCELLQRQWAKENGIKLVKAKHRWTVRMRRGFIPWLRCIQSAEWFYTVLTAQVKQYHPDVLYVQDMNGVNPAFLRDVRPYVKLITGQIAYPIARGADFREYDLILSSFPHFVERFRQNGLTSEYFKIGFEPRVLGRLKEQGPHYQSVFVGGLSTEHVDRIRLLEKIASSQAFDVWGYGINELDSKSPVRNIHHGNAWALEMYNILYNSKIVLNNHIGMAENYANNMRLYEATGVGAFLLTDYKDNLYTLFEPGKEVVAYTSAEECVELINYYLEHEEERKAIARAGQERTLAEYTYYERMKELVDIIHKHM